MSDLAPERVRPLLQGSFGAPYIYVNETPSTQDILRQSDHPHGAVALAEHQTAGRGRSGRRWDDGHGQSLLFSLLLRAPAGSPLPQLSLVAGVAVAAALERVTGLEALVKWPNDVLIGGAKVAGILLEASGTAVVCGVGVNVDQAVDDMPEETRFPATSLRIASGQRHDRGVLLATVLAELEDVYARWTDAGLTSIGRELAERNALRGRPVEVESGAGIAGEIAADGRLEVMLKSGEVVLVGSGEVGVHLPWTGTPG